LNVLQNDMTHLVYEPISIGSKMKHLNYVSQNVLRIMKTILKSILVLNNVFYPSNSVEHDPVYKPGGIHYV